MLQHISCTGYAYGYFNLLLDTALPSCLPTCMWSNQRAIYLHRQDLSVIYGLVQCLFPTFTLIHSILLGRYGHELILLELTLKK